MFIKNSVNFIQWKKSARATSDNDDGDEEVINQLPFEKFKV